MVKVDPEIIAEREAMMAEHLFKGDVTKDRLIVPPEIASKARRAEERRAFMAEMRREHLRSTEKEVRYAHG